MWIRIDRMRIRIHNILWMWIRIQIQIRIQENKITVLISNQLNNWIGTNAVGSQTILIVQDLY